MRHYFKSCSTKILHSTSIMMIQSAMSTNDEVYMEAVLKNYFLYRGYNIPKRKKWTI